jgi:hypothetical protein
MIVYDEIQQQQQSHFNFDKIENKMTQTLTSFWEHRRFDLTTSPEQNKNTWNAFSIEIMTISLHPENLNVVICRYVRLHKWRHTVDGFID